MILIGSDLRRKPLKEQSAEASMKARNEELKNQDKMTRNFYAEFELLQRRLDKVSDPSHYTELRRKNAELENRLKTLTREQKVLQIEHQRREKRLDKIIRQGEPESLRELHMSKKLLMQLNEKYNNISN